MRLPVSATLSALATDARRYATVVLGDARDTAGMEPM